MCVCARTYDNARHRVITRVGERSEARLGQTPWVPDARMISRIARSDLTGTTMIRRVGRSSTPQSCSTSRVVASPLHGRATDGLVIRATRRRARGVRGPSGSAGCPSRVFQRRRPCAGATLGRGRRWPPPGAGEDQRRGLGGLGAVARVESRRGAETGRRGFPCEGEGEDGGCCVCGSVGWTGACGGRLSGRRWPRRGGGLTSRADSDVREREEGVLRVVSAEPGYSSPPSGDRGQSTIGRVLRKLA